MLNACCKNKCCQAMSNGLHWITDTLLEFTMKPVQNKSIGIGIAGVGTVMAGFNAFNAYYNGFRIFYDPDCDTSYTPEEYIKWSLFTLVYGLIFFGEYRIFQQSIQHVQLTHQNVGPELSVQSTQNCFARFSQWLIKDNVKRNMKALTVTTLALGSSLSWLGIIHSNACSDSRALMASLVVLGIIAQGPALLMTYGIFQAPGPKSALGSAISYAVVNSGLYMNSLVHGVKFKDLMLWELSLLILLYVIVCAGTTRQNQLLARKPVTPTSVINNISSTDSERTPLLDRAEVRGYFEAQGFSGHILDKIVMGIALFIKSTSCFLTFIRIFTVYPITAGVLAVLTVIDTLATGCYHVSQTGRTIDALDRCPRPIVELPS